MNPLYIKLRVSIFKEGKTFVAYTPALDLSTCGKTYAEVERRFSEAVELFFEELLKKGTLSNVLSDLGWNRERNKWQPPTIVAHKMEKMKVTV